MGEPMYVDQATHEMAICPECTHWFSVRRATMPDDLVACPTCLHRDDRLYFYPAESDLLNIPRNPKEDGDG